MLELIDGAGEAEDLSRRSEADRLDELLPNMVESVDLALLLEPLAMMSENQSTSILT